MKSGFLYNSACFKSAYKRDEIVKRVFNTIDCPENNFKLIWSTNENIVFYAHTGSILVYNSFLPSVTVTIQDYNEGSLVFMTFELKKSTKTMIEIYNALLLVFEIFLVKSWLTNQLIHVWLLFMPIGMILYSLLISVAGLRLSSKKVLKVFVEALGAEF